MARLPFNVDAHTAALIGRENVSTIEGAIIELIKNAYDADARICALYLDQNAGALYLMDDGEGMDEQIITEHWMTIGNSSKTENTTSRGGRIQTGAKGIGRFALNKLADRCEMITARKDSGPNILDRAAVEKGLARWQVNWTDFKQHTNITEVSADFEIIHAPFSSLLSDLPNRDFLRLLDERLTKHGTVFKLTELSEAWGPATITAVKDAVKALIPAELSSVFKVYFFTDDQDLSQALVTSSDDDTDYDYRISFQVIGDNVQILIYRNEFDLKDHEPDFITFFNNALKPEQKNDPLYVLRSEYFHGQPLESTKTFSSMIAGARDLANPIGDFYGDIYFRKRSQTKKDRTSMLQKDITGRRAIAKELGGIKIYRDNFRVRPYGEPTPKNDKYDWLGLDAANARSPTSVGTPGTNWRAKADQMTGAVFISRTNHGLEDQANREGIVPSPEFTYFKDFLTAVIRTLENDRQRLSSKISEFTSKLKTAQSGAEAEIDVEEKEQEISAKARQNEAIRKSQHSSADDGRTEEQQPHQIPPEDAQAVIDSKNEQIASQRDEIEQLRVLATTGILTNTYIHEIRQFAENLDLFIKGSLKALRDENYDKLSKRLTRSEQETQHILFWYKITLELLKRDRRTQKQVDLIALTRDLFTSLGNVLKNKQISWSLSSQEGELPFKCFSADILSILHNLIANTVAIFDQYPAMQREIEISLHRAAEHTVIISYSDSGPGLADSYKKDPDKILEAFETGKRNSRQELIGTGMGMWIVNSIAREYYGAVDLSANINSTRGFHATITLHDKGTL